MSAVFACAILPYSGMNAVFAARKPGMPAKRRAVHVWTQPVWVRALWRHVTMFTTSHAATASAAENCIAFNSRR